MVENRKPLRDLVIYCDRASNTARELGRRLNGRRLIASPNSRLRSLAGVLCINYGTSHGPNFRLGEKSIVLNPPEAVHNAISKVTCYERFKQAGIPTLTFTTRSDEAHEWLRGGDRVLARKDGLSSGRGIHILESGSDLSGSASNADFYTKYFKKTHEYRVHVFRESSADLAEEGRRDDGTIVRSYRVIDITQKKRTHEGPSSDSGDSGLSGDRTLYQRVVRSLDNGWIHAHEDIHLPGEVKDSIEKAAMGAVRCLGLDFGAVDIIANFSRKTPDKLLQFAVLEINTAPGLANEVTLDAYTKAITELYNCTRSDRLVSLPRKRRKRVRKMVLVWITTKKKARVQRMRERWVYEDATGESK